MEEYITLEKYLYENYQINGISIEDTDFLVDRLVLLPSIRPFILDKVVKVCCEYIKTNNFSRKIIGKMCEILSCFAL